MRLISKILENFSYIIFIIKLIFFNLYLSSRESFENVDSWLKEIKNNSNPDVKVFLIGNKSDLEDK